MDPRRSTVMPPTILLAGIVAMVALHFLRPVATVLPLPWNLLGIVPLALGVAMNLAADRSFHAAGTTVRPFEESSALVTGGVFRITRNPMYLGFILILVGLALLLRSATPWVVIVAFAILLDRRFVSAEERMLAQRFGAEWDRYRRCTRRWL
jgi:protein-S-isoprenylcysteine O-methyltransferase Ste14